MHKRKLGSAKKWAETPDSGFRAAVPIPEGMELFKPKAGKYTLDIVPFIAGETNPDCEKGDTYFQRMYYVHGNIGVDKSQVLCITKNFQEKCPICEYRAELEEDDDADEDVIKSLLPKQRQLFLVRDRGDMDKGIQFWEMSYHLFGKMLKEEIIDADKEEIYAFFDPDKGYSIKVSFKSKKQGSMAWVEARKIDFVKREKPLPAKLLTGSVCLDDLIVKPKYKTLKDLFHQGKTKEGSSEDEEKEESSSEASAESSSSSESSEPEESKEESSEESKEASEASEESSKEESSEEKKPAKKPSKKPKAEKSEESEESKEESSEEESEESSEESSHPTSKPSTQGTKKGTGKKPSSKKKEEESSEEESSKEESEESEKKSSKKTSSKKSSKEKDPDWSDDDESSEEEKS